MVEVPSLIATLPTYIPGKPIDAVAREFGLNPNTIAKLASNENPLGTPPQVQLEMRDCLDKLHLYPDGAGVSLRETIASVFNAAVDRVVLGNGSAEIIEMIAKAFLGPNEHAIFFQYSFALYRVATLATNHNYKEVKVEASLKQNLHSLEQEIDENTKVIFLANPNNPTGMVITAEELQEFINNVPSRILIVIDEAYAEYINNPKFPQTLNYVRGNKYQNIIVLRTFSKIYGLAALRLGYGIAHPSICAAIEKVRSPFNTNYLAQRAGIVALTQCADFVHKSAEHVRLEKQFLYGALSKMGIKVYGQEGNFITLDLQQNANEIFIKLQAKGVIIRPLGGYGLTNFIRVSIGTHAENDKFISCLQELYQTH